MDAAEGQAQLDPFGETASPAVYVARDATRSNLARMARTAVGQERGLALTAAPGFGKTLLLKVLAARLGERARCVYLPYGALEPDDLAAWILGLLGVAGDAPGGADPREQLLAEAGKSGLALLIDDACSLPLESARALAQAAACSGGALRLVLAMPDGSAASRVIAAMGEGIEVLRWREPMSAEETADYVGQKLARAQPPARVRKRFDPEALGWIQRLSGGVPRRVNELAQLILHGAPEGLRPSWRDAWFGGPLDELSSP